MYRIFIFASVLLTFTSCFQERIELDYNVDENKKLVITSWISTLDDPQFVSVSQTVNYLGAYTPAGVSGAIVSIADELQTYTLTEKEQGQYHLPADWVARVGDIYQLTVQYDGKEYTASHQMRPGVEIENPRYQIAQDDEFIDSLKIYETAFDFQELPGEGDAYYGIDYIKGSPAKDSLYNGSYADDRFLDGLYFEEIVLSEDDRYFQIGDTVVVDFYSIGVETSDHLQEIENEIFRGSPFDAPPANVKTNISGGAVGYFLVADGRRVEMVIQ